jgi:putative hydrolase of the HAD superfamily
LVKSKPHIKVIGFDADDTLWLNEVHYRNIEEQFVELMKSWLTEREIRKELFRFEMETLSLYGYGAKSFTLSMISTAISISDGQVSSDVIRQIIDIGSEAIHIPYHTTWEHEHVADTTGIQPYMTLDSFHDLLGVFYQ